MSYGYPYLRNITPPVPELLHPHVSDSSHRYSYQSNCSYYSSPASVDTQLTTPPRSPQHHNGPTLLPKIRSQDQALDPVEQPQAYYGKSDTFANLGFPSEYYTSSYHSSPFHRSASPPECNIITPVSEASYSDAKWNSFGGHLPAATPSGRDSRASSVVSSHSHSRKSSGTSGLTEAAIRKYICPTTRPLPSYLASTSSNTLTVPDNSQLQKIAPSSQRPQAQSSTLPAELLFDSYAEPPSSTTLMEYLTATNPSPAIVRHTPAPSRQTDTHFWWDVRQIRTWSDFNLSTIQSIPGLTDLLSFPIPSPACPAPPRVNNTPDSVSALHDAHTAHYMTKVNAALKVALGSSPLSLRQHRQPHQPAPGSRAQPDFLSNYETDYERTHENNPRSRVVGLCRSYNQWNSGMRSDSPNSKIDYLRELALLHKYMREHNCRYGFIITEIELVCVRSGTEAIPNFGYLELASPVQLKTSEPDKMTAALALWYLSMLAKNQSLPDQCGWRTDVGTPVAQTRMKFLPERDGWMLKPEGREKRDAKRNRGYVWPNEPLNRKEYSKVKKSSKA